MKKTKQYVNDLFYKQIEYHCPFFFPRLPDFDDDGDADLDDFVMLRESFGNNYNLAPASPDLSQTPEPATMLLMAAGLPLLLKRKRKSR